MNQAGLASIEDIKSYKRSSHTADGLFLYIIVKSLDQAERRERLIRALENGKIGRIEYRPVSKGLLLKTVLKTGEEINLNSASFYKYFREPRGMVKIDKRHYLLTEIGKCLFLDETGQMLKEFRHPYFSFLH